MDGVCKLLETWVQRRLTLWFIDNKGIRLKEVLNPALPFGIIEKRKSLNGDYYQEKWLMPDEEIDSLEENSYFIMKDGSRMPLPQGAAHNTTHAKADNLYSDVMLYSECFYSEPKEYRPSPEVMNLDELEAIVINGVRFEFVKQV